MDALHAEQPISQIINTAAYTAVDAAEDPAEAPRARLINETAVGEIGHWAADHRVVVIQLSTDYVFGDDGASSGADDTGAEDAEVKIASRTRQPWATDSPTHPHTVYGTTKLGGERQLLKSGARGAIVRTAWVYSGAALPEHRDFVSTMMRCAQSGRAINVVDDQWGNPTNVFDLARGLWQLSHALETTTTDGLSVVHLTGSGTATWFQVAQEVYRLSGANPELVSPCTTAEYPTAAPRPHWSVLSAESWQDAGFSSLPEWRSGVSRAVAGRITAS